LETIQNKYKEDGTSFWAVIREEDGKFIGICGILKQLIDGKETIFYGLPHRMYRKRFAK
jgi:hypothetical protein